MTLCGPLRKPEADGGIAQCEPREETQVHKPGGVGILLGKLGQRIIEGNQLFVTGVQGEFDVVEIDAGRSPPLLSRFLSRARLRRIRRIASAAAAKKWPRLSQSWILATPTSRRYASWTSAVAWSVWPGLLLLQPPSGELAQLVVDEWQKLFGGLGIALLDGRQDPSHVAHQIPSRPISRRSAATDTTDVSRSSTYWTSSTNSR